MSEKPIFPPAPSYGPDITPAEVTQRVLDTPLKSVAEALEENERLRQRVEVLEKEVARRDKVLHDRLDRIVWMIEDGSLAPKAHPPESPGGSTTP